MWVRGILGSDASFVWDWILMKTSSIGAWLALAAVTLASSGSWAQLSKPTEAELGNRGFGPASVLGAANGPPGSGTDGSLAGPSADPRDFSGFWRSTTGPGGRRGGGAPGGPGDSDGRGGTGARGGLGGGPGGDFFPSGWVARGVGQLPDRILCLPQSGTQVGVDGPLLLTQTPEQITWASEEMHTIRRIFLTGGHTPDFRPNYYGEALAHWDGNTLVVETVGMKSLPAGAKMVERWTKSADGRMLEMKIGVVDSGGKPQGSVRTQNLAFSAGEQVYEWMCEDFNDEWLPGGAGYDDQVGKK
jgi:hypothetical protein